MLTLLKLFTRLLEFVLVMPLRLLRTLTIGIAFNPRLGPLRHIATIGMLYVAFAIALVYVVAPVRGVVGAAYQSKKLRYDAERWLATAIYDANGSFAGTFDPRLDSKRDINFTGQAIEYGGYTANPDHKSIPVQKVPENFWQCLKHLEDRHLGGPINPFGIDLFGVLKIPYTTVTRSLRRGRFSIGFGGSTLPMQLARVIYKTPPSRDETAWEKVGRKLSEWWTAPVIYQELTRHGDNTPLKQWAANHLWLAQRTGGAPLHGVAVTSRIVFGKAAKDLSNAEQFVLASAVNKPIILLEGSARLNAVRLDRWRHIVEVRARKCAQALIPDEAKRKAILFELVAMAAGPPTPKVKPGLQSALNQFAPSYAKRARANPRIRANVLMPSGRLGIREEMKQAFGFDWRRYVRGITTTLDVGQNLAFRQNLVSELVKLDSKWRSRLSPDFTLDPTRVDRSTGPKMPNVIVVAANAGGEIVRYYESSELAPYFGSVVARDGTTGKYVTAREPRQIASTGKMLAAIGIANQRRDQLSSLYIDREAPARGLETCRRKGVLRIGRRADVSFACSLSLPLEWRARKVGQNTMRHLIKAFGFNMPPAPDAASVTPPSTAAIRGLIAGSPRRVHHMASVVLASLTGRGGHPQMLPSLVRAYNFTSPRHGDVFTESTERGLRPDDVIRPAARVLVRAFLRQPLCYRDPRAKSHGTLKSLKDWCAQRRKGLRLHFAKTGTAVTIDPNATVDAWIAGGLQFTNGAAYSYVVVVGTGDAHEPFARRLHAAQVAAPLLRALLEDLEADSRHHLVIGTPVAGPAGRGRISTAIAARRRPFSIQDLIETHLLGGE